MQFYVLGDLRTDEWTYHAYASATKPMRQGDAPKCSVCHEYVGDFPCIDRAPGRRVANCAA
jgi:hypothetical protein